MTTSPVADTVFETSKSHDSPAANPSYRSWLVRTCAPLPDPCCAPYIGPPAARSGTFPSSRPAARRSSRPNSFPETQPARPPGLPLTPVPRDRASRRSSGPPDAPRPLYRSTCFAPASRARRYRRGFEFPPATIPPCRPKNGVYCGVKSYPSPYIMLSENGLRPITHSNCFCESCCRLKIAAQARRQPQRFRLRQDGPEFAAIIHPHREQPQIISLPQRHAVQHLLAERLAPRFRRILILVVFINRRRHHAIGLRVPGHALQIFRVQRDGGIPFHPIGMVRQRLAELRQSEDRRVLTAAMDVVQNAILRRARVEEPDHLRVPILSLRSCESRITRAISTALSA